MKKAFLILSIGLVFSVTTKGSPFLSVSPTFTKAQVQGEETTMGAGISIRGGYEFLNSRYFLSGHALELELGTTGFNFTTMDGIGKVDGQAMPIFANYRFHSVFWRHCLKYKWDGLLEPGLYTLCWRRTWRCPCLCR